MKTDATAIPPNPGSPDAVAFLEAVDGRRMPPMGYELMAAGLSDEDARFVARMLRQDGYHLVRVKDIGWSEINDFRGVLRRGQGVREDAG